ncbi:MAG: preprotein translocase subunit SecE [Christensenellaceae bacterium]|jgi:preprotein translocase subunit SecE|nr:preprotein translocase subunit SecE [Christensenellaceae bacterium]
MSSKSKRKHAQKATNRANTGASADVIKEKKSQKTDTKTATGTENAGIETHGAETPVVEVVLPPKEFKKMEAEKKKQAKQETKLAKKQAKLTKKSKSDKKEKGEKRNLFAGIGSELKKVHWPSWGETWKATGIVLGVVVVFGLVVFGIDSLLGWLYEMLIGGK